MREVREFKSRHPDHFCSADYKGNHLKTRSSTRHFTPDPNRCFLRVLILELLLSATLTGPLACEPTCAQESAEPHLIRVGLAHNVGKPHSLTVASDSSLQVRDLDSKAVVAEVNPGQRVSLAAASRAVEITVDGVGMGTFKGPVSVQSASLSSMIEVVSPKVRYKRYRGVLEVRSGPRLTVVNELDLEFYLYGVIPVEVPASFHPEAQKALGVAARTYAIRSASRHQSAGYNLCDGIHCQGYAGADRESDWARKIVDETQRQVAVYDGEPIYALYSSDCGGMTQNNEDSGVGKQPWPYLRSVVDNPGGKPSAVSSQQPAACRSEQEDYCAGNPHHSWSKTYTAQELEQVFSRSESMQVGKLVSMEFAEYDSSGRVKTVVIKGESGERRISGSRFREIFGLNTIMSTRMTLSVSENGDYVISGKGHGHGLGLCMHGANGLAKSRDGITYRDILKHYYTGVEVREIAECRLRNAD